ncbi:hypothetical protein GTA08_BOTSDO07076 [Botryosphaeria dothidea]|uniref:Uncharacterized protein n=1 Tax=Botryosphaeria dothidea TaxID=55169 RepID=A0A8H4IHY8_9PEZI|nr:hypothetical protein GTA08_BOTSDO11271 [Botryosphaeria dothidea]KAF4305691.1 hypothetical protein GTA08_BOTSDO07076 [Botryosphaeria dothidea]
MPASCEGPVPDLTRAFSASLAPQAAGSHAHVKPKPKPKVKVKVKGAALPPLTLSPASTAFHPPLPHQPLPRRHQQAPSWQKPPTSPLPCCCHRLGPVPGTPDHHRRRPPANPTSDMTAILRA